MRYVFHSEALTVLIGEQLNDQQWLSNLIQLTASELPAPKPKKSGSIGFYMQMFVINILKPYDRAESLENSLSPAKPA